jgi:hypothetical protein
LPGLEQVAKELEPRGVALVTVVTRGEIPATAARARAIVARLGITSPTVLADPALQDVYHVDHVPWTVVIGRDGKAADVIVGGQDSDFFRDLAKRYL